MLINIYHRAHTIKDACIKLAKIYVASCRYRQSTGQRAVMPCGWGGGTLSPFPTRLSTHSASRLGTFGASDLDAFGVLASAPQSPFAIATQSSPPAVPSGFAAPVWEGLGMRVGQFSIYFGGELATSKTATASDVVSRKTDTIPC